MRFSIAGTWEHARGRVFEARAGQRSTTLLFTSHALDRCARWGLPVRKVLRTLLFPEEVLLGHRGRFPIGVMGDDRVEIRSVGRLPNGVTVEMLLGPHLSRLRNPLIADAFHRTGAVEIWAAARIASSTNAAATASIRRCFQRKRGSWSAHSGRKSGPCRTK